MSFLTPGREGLSTEGAINLLRTRLAQLLLLFIAGASFALALAGYDLPGVFTDVAPFVNPLVAAIASVLFVVLLTGRYERYIRPVPVFWLVVITFTIYDDDLTLIVVMVLTAVAGALLTSRPVFWTMLAGIAARMLLHVVLVAQDTPADFIEETVVGTLVIGAVPILAGILIRYVISELEHTAYNAQRSADLLRASALIGQNMSEMLSMDELLPRAVDIIRDRFGFYHVQVFTVDENENYAHLTASTGQVGERMLARQHRLPISTETVVGRSILAQETIVARNSGQERDYNYNELLPHTRSELAIPLLDGQNVIGVLNVQSTRADVFNETEMQALRVIASQLATAIRNARLFERQEKNLRENKRLFIESETSLREIQRLNRQLTRQAWEDYLSTERRISGVTLTGQEFRNQSEWTDLMREAGQRRRTIINDDDENNVRYVAIPLELRGEVVGAVEMETDGSEDPEEISNMIQAISQRLAVSLDNARLFEETNEATAQEQRISEIVSQYQSADDVDDLLRITLSGLAETLGAETGTIRLGALPESDLAVRPVDTPSANGGTNSDSPHPNGGRDA
jgi:GAF domain-containing protein